MLRIYQQLIKSVIKIFRNATSPRFSLLYTLIAIFSRWRVIPSLTNCTVLFTAVSSTACLLYLWIFCIYNFFNKASNQTRTTNKIFTIIYFALFPLPISLWISLPCLRVNAVPAITIEISNNLRISIIGINKPREC
jgi:hypothetical protein